MTRELIFDAWTTLTFKRQFGPRKVAGQSWVAPGWVGDDHHRRLLAYKMLQSYIDNAAREWLADLPEKSRDEVREYGDAALLRNAALSALLGEEQTIAVDGAVEDEDEVDADALKQQEWLETWADDERLRVKVQECERNAVGLGDGVYTLGWSNAKNRPRLRVFDPGFYFPVLDDGNEDDYPERVHIAWEVEDDDLRRVGKVIVRRMTWELVDVAPYTPAYGSEAVTKECVFTDAEWEVESTSRSIDDLTGSRARYFTNEDGEELNQLPLGIDFIPVIHIPNTVALSNHFGQSVLATVAQILDDVSNTDTDLAAASATTGAPPISLSGVSMGEGNSLTYRPGMVFNVGENGRMDVLDTSKSLDALMKRVDDLLQRLSVNGRMPAALLGRVDPSEVPSGVALALSFGPLSAMIREMRLARSEKYQLIFKFVHRIALVGGLTSELPAEHATTRYELGPFLPNDEAAAVSLVTQLLNARAISLEQAVTILRSAGITDREQDDEVDDIQRRDFEGANQLLDATGDQAAVFEYLGLTPPTDPLASSVPGSNGAGGGQQPPAEEFDPNAPIEPAVPPTEL